MRRKKKIMENCYCPGNERSDMGGKPKTPSRESRRKEPPEKEFKREMDELVKRKNTKRRVRKRALKP